MKYLLRSEMLYFHSYAKWNQEKLWILCLSHVSGYYTLDLCLLGRQNYSLSRFLQLSVSWKNRILVGVEVQAGEVVLAGLLFTTMIMVRELL
uniref:Uncharacterized protein n=1 Tax=Arundo donax TaxID=35708 RepID=A0A0A9AXJ6_ARUDO